MTIEFQFRSITIQPSGLQDIQPNISLALQPYLPIHKNQKRRRPRKKKERVSDLIDALIDTIDSLE